MKHTFKIIEQAPDDFVIVDEDNYIVGNAFTIVEAKRIMQEIESDVNESSY